MSEERQILIVDDDDFHRLSLGDFLREEGFAIVEAPNGQVALDYLLAAQTVPSLILLDLNMPVMSGWEVIRVLRNYLRFTEIPVVVITGEGRATRPRHDNVHGTLTKPYRIDALMTLVHEHTGSTKSADAPRRGSRRRRPTGRDI